MICLTPGMLQNISDTVGGGCPDMQTVKYGLPAYIIGGRVVFKKQELDVFFCSLSGINPKLRKRIIL